MTNVTFLLIDSRLKTDRKVRTEVVLTEFRTGAGESPATYRLFATLAADYAVTEPLSIDIDDGMWLLEFTSYSGTKVGCALEVPAIWDTFNLDAAALEGNLLSESEQDEFTYKLLRDDQDLWKRNSVSEKADTWRFIPSSASSAKNGSRNRTQHHDSSWPKASLLEYIYVQGDHRERKRKRNFENLKSFDERFNYWMDGWAKLHHFEEIDWTIRKKANSKLLTGRTTVNVRSYDRDAQTRRLLLVLQFQEERYVLMLPGNWGSTQTSTLDIEVDYFSSPQIQTNGRVVQTRVLTDEPRFNGVAQLLGLGSLYSARNLWTDGAQDLLYRKYENPVAAAAAGLILVQPDVLGNREVLKHSANLDQWFLNLYNDFRWLSEGAICLAWLQGTNAYPPLNDEIENEEQLANVVSRLLQEAVDRGLPMYTEGLKLLSQGIDWAGENISVETKQAVRWLAMSSISAGPFLLLRCENYDGGMYK